ncbi:MAG: CoB--CoM heterodisulfide reductase iron-sulfur subunit A [Candidatus Bathyarchaeota archaeon BA2]|nr:MAG: CoB--CoM heterodisulfide reductase iron-sulfur subunit A [Candidatus Bathyarchaeota archaeon BA2]
MREKSSVLVIGGGIAGIQASLDLADRGLEVYLVEKTPSIGGRMAQLDKTFPTMDCSICILAPKMIECFRHPNIKLLTYSEVEEVSGSAGNFTVKVLRNPRFVDESKCTGCGTCMQKCPIKVPNEFEMGLGMRRAIYLPFPQAVPRVATIDKDNCLYFQKGVCKICEKFCQANAVDFDKKPEELTINVSAIIIATGFNLFNPSIIGEYGYKQYKNVITSLELERLVNASGPTGGKLLRPSDGKEPNEIAFIQCVGSRSQRKKCFPYCSSVCCMYATKESIILKEHKPEVEVYIFYIELRVFGKGFQEFVTRAREEWDVEYIRGRPDEIIEDPKTRDLIVRYEDTLDRKVKELKVGLVVLCPALIPNDSNTKLEKILGAELDEHGFFKSKDPLFAPVDTNVPGIFICGYSQGPKDIPESVAQSSGAAARAAEVIALVASEEN